MAGNRTERVKGELNIVTVVWLGLSSCYHRVVSGFSLREKKTKKGNKERSLQVPQTGPIPLSLVTAECNFDSCYQEQTAQT